MALKSFVYVSEVDNLSDARFAAGMGVDLVGFKLDPTDEQSLDKAKFDEISEWIAGVKIVGEFGATAPDQVKELLEAYKLDYLLIENEELINEYSLFGLPLILKMQLDDPDHMSTLLHMGKGIVDYFLIEAQDDTLDAKAQELIRDWSSSFPMLLGFGITAQNVSSLKESLGIEGIALKGSPELRPGYKEFDELADILEELEID